MEFSNNIPIYIQVINEIKKDMVNGVVALGEKLPSGRELAFKYKINPNTANRIYKEMESEEICYTKRGLGTYVTEDVNKLKLYITAGQINFIKTLLYYNRLFMKAS